MKKIIYIIIMFLCLLHCLHAFTNTSNTKLTLKIYNGAILFDDLNSHMWWWEPWGQTVTTLSYTEFDGKKCLKTENMRTNEGGWGALLRTDHYFKAEDWESFDSMKCNIFLAENQSGIKIKLEIRNNVGIIEAITSSELTYNTWNNITWNFNASLDYSNVSKIIIVIEGLHEDVTRTIYFDNMRLSSGGSDEMWDDFNDQSYKWRYADFSDAVNFSPESWMGACESISHNNVENAATNAGCIYMQWNQARTNADYAQVENDITFNENLQNIKKISFRARCSSSSAKFKVGFSDSNWLSIESAETNVSTANTWETIILDLPTSNPSFLWNQVIKLRFIVKTDTAATGEIFIDDIKLLPD